ncbi:hydrogenase maturation protease [Clostridium sp. DJ247]|uniref:hydrogenase maturation protease n=1 Tax=Clostridium sp. DJ247 TaxID=2726188 RepID=UPI0016264866|nr:hydrogenase maturation protease [Clostridium sp. DJ247]MBC2581710.1 hydrogenase maturation protease [Clostridium sp. DJ247]
MKVKAIAIGNTLMEDDGIGIAVAEKIKEELINNNVEVIIGETDFQYCISLIEDGDFIFVVDAAYYGKNPGEITIGTLENYKYEKNYFTQHSYSAIDLIKLYYKSVKGYIIGIEVNSVSFKLGLSKELESKIHIISKEVLENILLLLTSKNKEEE